jgi:hypothetical protein
MPYKENCGFKKEIDSCGFKEKNCEPRFCDLFRLDFYDKAQLQAEWDAINAKILELQEKEKFAFEHPFKDLKKTRQLAGQLADFGAGKKIIRKAQEWHSKNDKV